MRRTNHRRGSAIGRQLRHEQLEKRVVLSGVGGVDGGIAANSGVGEDLAAEPLHADQSALLAPLLRDAVASLARVTDIEGLNVVRDQLSIFGWADTSLLGDIHSFADVRDVMNLIRSRQPIGSATDAPTPNAAAVLSAPATDAVPGEYLMRFNSLRLDFLQRQSIELQGMSRSALSSAIEDVLGVAMFEETRRGGVRAARTYEEGGLDREFAESLLATGLLDYIEPNWTYTIDAVPNDPDFGVLWGLDNTGQNGGYADIDIDAPEAWDIGVGDPNIVVAVMDTGIDFSHPDLADNIWTNEDEMNGVAGVDDDGNGYIDDMHGWNGQTDTGDASDDHYHGTHVAGIIGAVGNNGIGVTGVNWRTSLMSAKNLNASGNANCLNNIIALEYVINAKESFDAGMGGANVRVINASFGGAGFCYSFRDLLREANEVGIAFVAAAGNGGPDFTADDIDVSPHYPTSYDSPNIIGVTAHDRYGHILGFANYGAKTVALAAPGFSIISTTPMIQTDIMTSFNVSPMYNSLAGTSMAAPHVSGIAALVLAQFPDLTPAELRIQIMNGATPSQAYNGRLAMPGVANAIGALGGTVDRDGDGRTDELDCAPLDPQAWRSILYHDVDEDGVPDTSIRWATTCVGSVIPPGFTDNENGPDNCVGVLNPGQEDHDGDGIGDPCEALSADGDGDGQNDDYDCAPDDPTRWTRRAFNDLDRDGVRNSNTLFNLPVGCFGAVAPGSFTTNDEGPVDNCGLVANPDQLDTDGDGIGDACDETPFGDGSAQSSSWLGRADGAAVDAVLDSSGEREFALRGHRALAAIQTRRRPLVIEQSETTKPRRPGADDAVGRPLAVGVPNRRPVRRAAVVLTRTTDGELE